MDVQYNETFITFHLHFICLYLHTSNAQVRVSTRDLMGIKWQLAIDYDNQSKDYDEYIQGIKIWHREDGSTYEYPYYLSKTKPTKFDYTKVGVITEGCYIVMTNPKWGDLYCFSIKDFYKGDGTMVLENEFEDGETLNIMIPSNKPRNQLSKQKSKSKW